MTAPMPTVSVVIPTRGRAERLARTVAPLLADPATTEVVVVVDGDDAETRAALAAEFGGDERLRVVAGSPVDGPPAGEQRVRDQGARVAAADVVLALDDDIVAAPGLVSGHAAHHEAADDLVVLGYVPVAPPPPGRRWNAATRLYAENYERACAAMRHDGSDILANLWGGNFSVRRDHWLAADATERVPLAHMHTDREFGLRLRSLGLRARFDDRLTGLHEDVRDVERLVEAARGTAIAHAQLAQRYDDLGDERNSHAVISTALRPLDRHPRAWSALRAGLLGATRAAGGRDLGKLEYGLARGLSRLEYERALRDANARLRRR